MALLTVVLPTYRRPVMVRRALTSVLEQSFQDLLVRVCDNASGDETRDVVAECSRRDPRVLYHCQEQNIGLERNFAAGLALVDTPFFTFLSDDDLVLPGAYASLMERFSTDRDVMVSCGEALHVIAPKKLYNTFLRDWAPGAYEPPRGAVEVLRHGLPFWSAMIFRRETVACAGAIDPDTGALIDLDFALRVLRSCKLFVDKTPCAIFFSHESAVSRVKHIDFVWPGWRRLTENLLADSTLDSAVRRDLEHLLKKRLGSELSFAALGCLRKARFEEAYEGGTLLRQFADRKALGFAIQALARVGRHVGVVSDALTVANHFRRWRSSRRIDETRYRAELDYLNLMR